VSGAALRLLAMAAGAGLVLAAARSVLRARLDAGPTRSMVACVAAAAARVLTPRATRVRALELPARLTVARRQIALIGDAGLAARALGAAAPGDPASALPGMRLLLAGLGLLAAFVAAPLVGSTALPIAVALPIAAALVPDLALGAAARRMRGTVIAALPDILDLLATCACAGQPLEQSIRLAADHSPAPLAALLGRAATRQAAGQGPAAALRLEAERTGIDRVISLAALIERNQELGLPLEAPLRRLADAARAEARTDCLARAARAVPLAGVLTALVIAPACVAGLAAVVLCGVLTGGGL
jgi:Flp pilus assembly protein TadB